MTHEFVTNLVWLIPLPPVIAFALIVLFTNKSKALSHTVAISAAFLFPWAVSLHEIGASGFWAMMIFLGILVVGFAYEWKKGALDWE